MLVQMCLIESSYLSRRHKVERPKGTSHVWNVGLEIMEGIGDAGLNLIGLLP